MKKVCDWTGEVQIHFEHTVEYNGYTYLLMFGSHINGGFIFVPNWNWGCEASDMEGDAMYNAEKLMHVGADEDVAMELAKYIDKVLKKMK